MSFSAYLSIMVLAALLVLYILQSKLIFGRTKRVVTLAPIEDSGPYHQTHVSLSVPGATLQGLVSRSESPGSGARGVLLYLPGRNEDATWSGAMAGHLRDWVVVSFNYRGAGQSTGYPGERVCKADARHVYHWIRSQPWGRTAPVALVGRSLGSAIAVSLASQFSFERVVLFSPFPSLSQVISSNLGMALLRPLLRHSFECASLAPRIAVPCLVLLADSDNKVPHRLSHALASRLGGDVVVQCVSGTSHKSLPRSPSAQRKLTWFLASTSPRSSLAPDL